MESLFTDYFFVKFEIAPPSLPRVSPTSSCGIRTVKITPFTLEKNSWKIILFFFGDKSAGNFPGFF
jgi:hypothetical protein